MSETAIIILAAGNSARLGRPKQLLPYKGKTLIGHIVGEAYAASLHPIVVVTGAFAPEISDALKGQPVEIFYNPNWETGMGSGVVTGLSGLLGAYPGIQSVIITVCDQPFISALLFQQLIERKALSGKEIIACSYSDTVGTPVLFGRPWFEKLLNLSGNEGAKKLLQQHKEDMSAISFPEGDIDIDTEEDYRRLS